MADTDLDLALGALVTACRKRKKLTQTGLARLLDISQSHMSRIEVGARPVTVNEADRLNAIFQTDVVRRAHEVIDIAERGAKATKIVSAADLIPIVAAKMPK